MYNDVKQLTKIAVKIDKKFEATNPLHKKRLARLLKRAFVIEKKLITAMGRVLTLKNKKEVKDAVRNQLAWMEERMTARRGRKIQSWIT